VKLLNRDEVIREVTELVWMEDISFLDASLLYCERNQIEVETFAAFIKGLKGSEVYVGITADAKKLNMLKVNK